MSCNGEITLSEADSMRLSQLSWSLVKMVFLVRVSSSDAGKLPIVSRIVTMNFFGLSTGFAGIQNATSTPDIVGCIPEFRNKYRKIVFAVFDDHNSLTNGVSNYDAFKEVFG